MGLLFLFGREIRVFFGVVVGCCNWWVYCLVCFKWCFSNLFWLWVIKIRIGISVIRVVFKRILMAWFRLFGIMIL